MTTTTTHVSYDRRIKLALITGPGGFTQIRMEERNAKALATVLGVELEVTG